MAKGTAYSDNLLTAEQTILPSLMFSNIVAGVFLLEMFSFFFSWSFLLPIYRRSETKYFEQKSNIKNIHTGHKMHCHCRKGFFHIIVAEDSLKILRLRFWSKIKHSKIDLLSLYAMKRNLKYLTHWDNSWFEVAVAWALRY